MQLYLPYLFEGGIYTKSENLLLRKREISKEILEFQEQVNLLPGEKLVCIQNGKYEKWFHSQNGKRSYIPKSNQPLAEQLALKTYLSCHIEDLKDEQNALDSYFKHYNPEQLRTNKLLLKPAYQKLLANYFRPLSQELYEWSQEPYERNPKYPEGLIHKSISGNILRSKSEAMIDMLLYQSKIPFRYECPLTLNNILLYPDFTIRHPHTGETYYWEHFGMMDSPLYHQNYLKKMRIYLENDIFPDINLITTFETGKNPLTAEKVQEKINNCFL